MRRPLRVPAVLAVVCALVLPLGACQTTTGDDTPVPEATGKATAEAPVAGPEPIRAPLDERPNIVLVSADDMRLDEMRYLPKTRKLLGSAGLTFRNALTPHPLCCPARAAIVTGQYAQNNGVRSNFPPQGGYGAYDPSESVATMLNDAGYNTAMVGKHLNGYRGAGDRDPGWTIFDPSMGGFGNYYRFQQYADGAQTQYPGYYTVHIDAKAVLYARQLSGFDAPFFMWVSHYAPHSTNTPAGACEGGQCREAPPLLSPRYRQQQVLTGHSPMQKVADRHVRSILKKPSYNEADVSDKQHYIRAQVERSPSHLRALVRARAGALASLDDATAHLVAGLKADGELDNTYLVFVTDNGYLLGEHRAYKKIVGYEESVRTPMLVRGPGVSRGSSTEEVGTLIDLVSTFLDIADAPATLKQDGRSLLPLWKGRTRRGPHRGGVLIQAGPLRAEKQRTGWYYRGVRTDRYTYMKFFSGFVELYDREQDPFQLRSVAGSPRYAAVERELRLRTRKLVTCAGPASCNRDFGPVPQPLP